ncbi:MAG: lysozyme inhibitor LprI family protein [Phyllobacterium sp.]
MKIVLISTALICLALITPSRAQDCDNAESQHELNECAGASYKKSDKALNAAYQNILKRLKNDAETKKLLTQAQRAWISYRDAECTFATAASADGSIYPMLVASCKDELTQTRTKDLKTYLSCEEGDMSCPVPSQ